MGHMTITTPFLGTVSRRWAGTSYDQTVYQIWKIHIHPLRRYERRQKYRNWDGLEIRGTSRSSAI